MKIENYIDMQSVPGVSGLFYACTSRGVIDGKAKYTKNDDHDGTVYTHENADMRLSSRFTVHENGVVIRRDSFENLSDEPLEIYEISSRFHLDGDSYEVYTQYSGWQHESDGGWQRLVTQVTAASEGIRSCDGAAPIMALQNLYTKAITVFHLMPNAKWKMTIRKHPQGEKEHVVAEMGIADSGMHLTVAAGEVIELAPIIFYRADNRENLGMNKLHTVFNKLYPRSAMPILYNSWLYCFDRLNSDELNRQIDCAAELGIEAFMIDAGWFGEGKNWYGSVGDWTENPSNGLDGGLTAISERVRSRGMIFGLWFEPERAAAASRSVREHPEYYIGGEFLDFSREDARQYMLDMICEAIDKYHIGWLKFDFNATVVNDPSGNAFYQYILGQKKFIGMIRARYPKIYITNCASGGGRMDLYQSTLFDDFWPSDNESQLDGLTIVKNTLKRMPSGLIQRWSVQKQCEGFPWYDHDEKHGLMLSCRGATWDFVENVRDNYTMGYLSGGPIGFSCDIAAFTDEYKEQLKAHIAALKADREFYLNASARLLADTDRITVIEYADEGFNRCVIQVFTKKVYAADMIVYPHISLDGEYSIDGTIYNARDIAEDGIVIKSIKEHDCRVLNLVRL